MHLFEHYVWRSKNPLRQDVRRRGNNAFKNTDVRLLLTFAGMDTLCGGVEECELDFLRSFSRQKSVFVENSNSY